MIMLRARISGVEMPSACRLTTLPEVALCQLPEVSQDVHYRDNGVFIISGPSSPPISLRKKFTAECTRETIFAQALGRTRPRPSQALLESTLFRKNTTGAAQSLRAAAWPMADSLAGHGSTSQRNNQQIIWPKQFGSLRASPTESARRSQRRYWLTVIRL